MNLPEIKYDHSVASLVHYIKIFEILEEDPYTKSLSPTIYRGEAENYYHDNYNKPVFNASSFRESERPVKGYEGGINLPFQEKVDSFKYEVWNEIENDTRKNFLAYSQHHGIKTNLLDFTDNPLVALFFAIQNLESEIGYVYLYKSPVLDITPLFKNNDETNILDIISNNDNKTVQELLNYFWGFGTINKEFTTKYCYLLAQDFIRLKESNYDKYIQINDDFTELNEIFEIALESETNSLIKQEYDEVSDVGHAGLYYLILLRAFIKLKKSKFDSIGYELEGIMPMVYRPVMNFKRGINQNGLFLYQNYITSKGKFLIAKQKLQPTKIIRITNKDKILSSLNRLNINSKFIYGDHSNIAKYIESEYEKIKEIQKNI